MEADAQIGALRVGVDAAVLYDLQNPVREGLRIGKALFQLGKKELFRRQTFRLGERQLLFLIQRIQAEHP